MAEKVRVSVRARPLIKREKDNGDSKNWKIKGNVIQSCQPTTKTSTGQPYNFDRVFDEEMQTSDVYNQVVLDIVEKSLQGYNGTVMCYGQTSSGKTHTLYGTDKEPGIISLAADHLFELIQNDTKRLYFIKVGLLEVYNEKLSDLLNNGKEIAIHEKNGVVAPTDLQEIDVISPDELLNAAKLVQEKRKVGETKMNSRSSRSHTILRIFVESVPNQNAEVDEEEEDASPVQVTNALLNFVDLAGSEKANQTGAAGVRFKEATFINKSLSVLSQVVMQLSGTASYTSEPNSNSGSKSTASQKGGSQNPTNPPPPQFVNYRDSKLTRLLQSSLSGNAYISLICNITPAVVEETASTLRFARTAKNIKVDPTKNQGPPTNAQYKITIKELENTLSGKTSEVENLRKKITFLEKFYQDHPAAIPSSSSAPPPLARRKTVAASLLNNGSRRESLDRPTDSLNSDWLTEKQLLLFKIQKAEAETVEAKLIIEKVMEENESMESEITELKLRLSRAEELLKTVKLGKNPEEPRSETSNVTEAPRGHLGLDLHYAGSISLNHLEASRESRRRAENLIRECREDLAKAFNLQSEN